MSQDADHVVRTWESMGVRLLCQGSFSHFLKRTIQRVAKKAGMPVSAVVDVLEKHAITNQFRYTDFHNLIDHFIESSGMRRFCVEKCHGTCCKKGKCVDPCTEIGIRRLNCTTFVCSALREALLEADAQDALNCLDEYCDKIIWATIAAYVGKEAYDLYRKWFSPDPPIVRENALFDKKLVVALLQKIQHGIRLTPDQVYDIPVATISKRNEFLDTEYLRLTGAQWIERDRIKKARRKQFLDTAGISLPD